MRLSKQESLLWKGFEVHLCRSFRASISLRLKTPKLIEVKSPWLYPTSEVLAFLNKKEKWIQQKCQAPKDAERESYHEILKKDHRKLQAYAEAVLPDALKLLEKQTSLKSKGLQIRNQKRQWGSCDSKGVLRLNFRLAFLPKVLQNYIIIHELAHLVEMNHSPKFWAIVATHCPDYKTHRARLKHYRI